MTNPAEELASKAMGAAKATKAALTGLHGIFRHLAEEHGEVSALLMRVKMSNDPSVRAELFPKIRNELLSHEQGELINVYPIYEHNPETASIAKHHAAEASGLRQQLDLLSKTAFDSPAWEMNFGQLVELVNQHVKEEEGEYFPAGQRAFGDRAEAMLTAYKHTKQIVMAGLTEETPH